MPSTGAYGLIAGGAFGAWRVLTTPPEALVEDTTLWQLDTALQCAFGGKAVGLALSVVYAAYHKMLLAKEGSGDGARAAKKKA